MVNNLIAGFSNFKKKFFGDDKSFYDKLVKRGQSPKTIVISCSDSRVEPAILFGTRPGDLFVIRNVANLVPPYQPDDNYHGISAAIEFGVRDLGVREIVVLGHAYCGGIKALCSHARGEKQNDREFITSWISIAMPAMDKFVQKNAEHYNVHEVEKEAIVNSLNNLRTFPWLKSLEIKNELQIHGWWFDMEHGTLWAYNGEKRAFYPIKVNDKTER